MNGAPALAAPRRRVLVVDANPETRALYEQSFLTAGFDVVPAADGREALTKALVHPPHLVVMELRLPLIDGFALCEILRRDRTTTRVPMLVVTAETRPVELERIRRIGADDVLLKPVPPDVLAQRAGELVAASDDPERNGGGIRSRFVLPDAARLFMSEGPRRRTAKAMTLRALTVAPPLRPPSLTCPSCDRTLTYCVSQTGGVSDRHAEQWDYFACSTCGGYQYRQRTRKLRRLDESEEQWLQRQRLRDVE
jgi:CheY-like chemotaxis protein